MRDLTDPKLLYAKGLLFVTAGLLAGGLLLLEHPTPKTALLLALSAWCFARAYYFAFYVIERYVDPGYRFAGLWSLARYLLRRRRGPQPPGGGNTQPAAPAPVYLPARRAATKLTAQRLP